MTAEKRAQRVSLKKETWLGILFFGLICLHGGYFYHESILFGLIGSGLWALALWRSRKSRIKIKLFEGREPFLPFLYWLAYVIPLLWSGPMHLYGIWKMLAPLWLALTLLLFAKPLTLLRQALRAYLWSLLAALLLYAVQLALAKLGWPAADNFLTTVAIKGRFTGFLQYANVNAILSLLAGFYAVYAGEKLGFVMLAGFSLGLSGSRTAWLIAVILWFGGLAEQVWAASQKRKKKLSAKNREMALKQQEQTDQEEQEIQIKQEIQEKQNSQEQKDADRLKRKKEIISGFLFIAALFLGGLLLTLSSGGGRWGEGLRASEWQTRLLYYKDGLMMLLKKPWGYGTYGYYMIQRQFQTGSTYFVKYIHNFFLQILLDGGVISGLLFGLLLLKTLYSLVWGRASATTKRQAGLIGVLLLTLIGHAFWDFDLEFSYAFLLIWLIYFYAARPAGLKRQAPPGRGLEWKRQCRMGASVFFTVILTGGGLFLGLLSWQTYEGQYDLPANLGFPDAALGILQDSNRPVEEKWRAAKKMERAAVKNVETFAFLRDYYYNKGEWEPAIAYGRQAIELAPLWLRHRQELMRIEYAYALTHPADLAAVAEDILGVPEVLDRLRQERATMLNVKHRPVWEMTEEMKIWYRHFQELDKAWKERL